jgi:hypothetical protein
MFHITVFPIGKSYLISSIHGQFSIAMSNYRRIYWAVRTWPRLPSKRLGRKGRILAVIKSSCSRCNPQKDKENRTFTTNNLDIKKRNGAISPILWEITRQSWDGNGIISLYHNRNHHIVNRQEGMLNPINFLLDLSGRERNEQWKDGQERRSRLADSKPEWLMHLHDS